MKETKKKPERGTVPTVPELEHAKNAVLNSLNSLQSRRSCDHAMTEFVAWYCPAARLAFNRTVVLQYRTFLEKKQLAASTINVRLAAVRRLAYEAADSGMLSRDVVAGIRRVKGVRQIGQKVGNWLSVQHGNDLLSAVSPQALRGKSDAAMLSLLLACGLRRSEVVTLASERIQQREGHWAIVDLVGKAGHVRTMPIPVWVKDSIDTWTKAAGVKDGLLFCAIRKNGVMWGNGLTQNVVWSSLDGAAPTSAQADPGLTPKAASPGDCGSLNPRYTSALKEQRSAIIIEANVRTTVPPVLVGNKRPCFLRPYNKRRTNLQWRQKRALAVFAFSSLLQNTLTISAEERRIGRRETRKPQ